MQGIPQLSPDVTSLLPESTTKTLSNALLFSIAASAVIAFVFVILYVLGYIRKCKVERAILDMQKDVAAIKLRLDSQNSMYNKIEEYPQASESNAKPLL